MKLKKLIALGLATVMSASMLVGCGAKSDSNASTDNGDKVFKVGMITDTGGVNDESFNQSTWKGFQDAQEKFGKDKLEIKYLERIVYDQGTVIDNLTSRITRLESFILNSISDRGDKNFASLEHSRSFSGFPTNKTYGLQMGGLYENDMPYRRSSDNINKEGAREDRSSQIHIENESTEDILKILSSSFHN